MFGLNKSSKIDCFCYRWKFDLKVKKTMTVLYQIRTSKINYMKKIITLILILLAFTNCTDNDDEASPVVGTWKLVKTRNFVISNVDGKMIESFTDYSDKNITYRFDTNSNLTINTDGEIETHKYEYKLDYLSGAPSAEEKKEPFVIIDDSKWTYFVSGQEEMVLGKSYVDGSDLYFVRQ